MRYEGGVYEPSDVFFFGGYQLTDSERGRGLLLFLLPPSADGLLVIAMMFQGSYRGLP
jgi:hypothetical protein